MFASLIRELHPKKELLLLLLVKDSDRNQNVNRRKKIGCVLMNF